MKHKAVFLTTLGVFLLLSTPKTSIAVPKGSGITDLECKLLGGIVVPDVEKGKYVQYCCDPGYDDPDHPDAKCYLMTKQAGKGKPGSKFTPPGTSRQKVKRPQVRPGVQAPSRAVANPKATR